MAREGATSGTRRASSPGRPAGKRNVREEHPHREAEEVGVRTELYSRLVASPGSSGQRASSSCLHCRIENIPTVTLSNGVPVPNDNSVGAVHTRQEEYEKSGRSWSLYRRDCRAVAGHRACGSSREGRGAGRPHRPASTAPAGQGCCQARSTNWRGGKDPRPRSSGGSGRSRRWESSAWRAGSGSLWSPRRRRRTRI